MHRLLTFLTILAFGSADRALAAVAAQDSMHMGHMHYHGAPAPHATPSHVHHGTTGHAMHHPSVMMMHPLGFPAGREASGTSWLPDATAHRHFMGQLGRWTWMAHGMAFLGYDRMNGLRGDDRVFAPNMVMMMADRAAGPSTRWRLAGMFSTDAATVGGQGYPLLLQTGETWNNVPLHDHQHPHNVFSELSASLTRTIGSGVALHLYAAPVGEPALGPPSYPHRPVADSDPLAPIGHHWQDATHIAYGVATAGLQTQRIQIEGSVFNGQEPGENRAEIRHPEFDSGSGRLSVNPNDNLALQISHGYLRHPEAPRSDDDAWRTTASVAFARKLSGAGSANATVVWGRNRERRIDLDSWVLEGQWAHEHGLTPFARLERVEKTSEELVLPASFAPDAVHAVGQVTLGATHELPIRGRFDFAVGAQAVLSFVPNELDGVYGSHPSGWVAFLRVRPAASEHSDHMH